MELTPINEDKEKLGEKLKHVFTYNWIISEWYVKLIFALSLGYTFWSLLLKAIDLFK